MHPSIDRLERRTAQLERTVRALLLTIGAGAVGLVLTAATKPDVVRAHAFELLSEDGAVRAELTIRDGEPGLYLKDPSGTDRVAIFHRIDASGIYVLDAEGVTRIGVAQFAHGGGGVALHGPGSKGAAVLYLKGTGSLRFFDADGTVTNQVLGSRPAEAESRGGEPAN